MKSLTILTALLFTTSAYCARINYDYDNAGNRVKRYIIVEEIDNVVKGEFRSGKEDESLGKEDKAISEEEVSIKVYPNPTTGIVNVDIANVDETENNTLHLYDSRGELITSRKRLQGNNVIDFMNTPNGIYILKLNIGDKEKSYKIIKK